MSNPLMLARACRYSSISWRGSAMKMSLSSIHFMPLYGVWNTGITHAASGFCRICWMPEPIGSVILFVNVASAARCSPAAPSGVPGFGMPFWSLKILSRNCSLLMSPYCVAPARRRRATSSSSVIRPLNTAASERSAARAPTHSALLTPPGLLSSLSHSSSAFR